MTAGYPSGEQATQRRAPAWVTPALLTPLFLGTAPVLGKLAYQGGSDPFTVAAVRTVLAALILWAFYALVWRRYMFIYPAGLLGCAVIGTVNGVGSLMYYNGLNLLNASVAQLLNSSYLIFVVVLARIGGQPITVRTLFRVALAMVAILMLTGGVQGTNSWLGIGLMLGSSILFAGTIMLSQRVLYEMPARTVTLYVLSAMAVVVVMARAIYKLEWLPPSGEAAWAIAALGLTTALSRLTLFSGVKHFGSLQTVLLGILETVVALLLSFVFLGERLTGMQWAAVVVLGLSLLLVRADDLVKRNTQTVPILNMAGMHFGANHEAFIEAFAQKRPEKRATSTPSDDTLSALDDQPEST